MDDNQFQELCSTALMKAVKVLNGRPDAYGKPLSLKAHQVIYRLLVDNKVEYFEATTFAAVILGTAWICKTQNLKPEKTDPWLADETGLTDLVLGSMYAGIDCCEGQANYDLSVLLSAKSDCIDDHISKNLLSIPQMITETLEGHGYPRATNLDPDEVEMLEQLRDSLHKEYKKVDDFLKSSKGK